MDRNLSDLSISQLIQFWSETNIKIYNRSIKFFMDPKNKNKTIYDAIQELIILLGTSQTLIVLGVNIILISIILLGIFVIKN